MSPALVALLTSAALQDAVPSPSPSPVRIHGEIKEPRQVKAVPPEYPREAARAGLQGVVVLECSIDPQGKVAEAKVVSGVPPLTDAALKAVKQWRYTPTLLSGTPVPVIMTVTVNFKHHFRFVLEDVLDSLKSKNEYIRESAARMLGTVGHSAGVAPSDKAAVARELKRVAERDEKERVRAAATEALARLQGQ